MGQTTQGQIAYPHNEESITQPYHIQSIKEKAIDIACGAFHSLVATGIK